MDDVFNHVILVYAYSATIVGFWAFQPGGGEALAPGVFIGPLTAVRLQNRRHIAAHIGAATLGLVTLGTTGAIFGFLDMTTIITILVMTPAIWVLGLSCTVVLEASEQQGEELERLVRRDPLTGVGNRRLLEEQMAKEIARHSRTGQQLSIITLDLNGFKALNDTLGHAAGDELLRDVATALTRATRREDTVVRQGGDEFVVLLPNTIPAHAQRTVNAIRAGLATTETGGLVSSGFGIATYPGDALTGDVLLHVADERLIADKEADPIRRTRSETVPGDRFAPANGPARFDAV
jgi:diguanylate cyclase (GGDEF)-like protein